MTDARISSSPGNNRRRRHLPRRASPSPVAAAASTSDPLLLDPHDAVDFHARHRSRPPRRGRARPRRPAEAPRVRPPLRSFKSNRTPATDVAPAPTAASRMSPSFGRSSTRTSIELRATYPCSVCRRSRSRTPAAGRIPSCGWRLPARPDRLQLREHRRSSRPRSTAAPRATSARATPPQIDTNARSGALFTIASPVDDDDRLIVIGAWGCARGSGDGQ